MARGGDGAVLVHCERGVSRSASLAMAFLMKHRAMSRDDAYVAVKRARRVVEPNAGFWKQLGDFPLAGRQWEPRPNR